MKIKLQNIGIIEEADINIEGITLIAGQNDSGKSTIGKVLYSIIKGFNQDVNLFHEEKNGMIIFHYQNILKELKKNDPSNVNEYQTKEINAAWIEKIENLIDLESFIDSKKIISQSLRSLKDYDEREYNTKQEKENEIEDWFHSEIITFHNLFNLPNKMESKIEIDDLEGTATITHWYPNISRYYLKLDNDLETYFKEAYFIESPAIIDDSLQRFVGKENLQLYTRSRQEELVKALSNPLTSNILDYSIIYDDISKIISGEITIDLLEGVRYKKNDQEIDIKNTAVGIKSFGIIQLLLKNNRLNNRTLLIIDEPEVHLHPTWQIKYAEILVRLSKDFDIPMVLTSHSPYFIEAIESFSKKYKHEKSTNFYFSEKNDSGLSSKIINVNGNLSKIYSSISEASYQLRNILKDE